MKRILISILLLLTFASPSWATPYYAGNLAGQNINYTSSAGWYPTSTGSCTGSGTPVTIGNFGNGDILNANGCAGITVNVDPGSVSVTVNLSTVGTGGTAGGTFLYTTTASPPATVHANCTAGSTNCLTVSGASGSTGTITGTCTGSASGAFVGCYDSHNQAAGTMTYAAGTGGNGAATAYGIEYTLSTTGNPVVVTTCTAASTASEGIGCLASGAIMTVVNCVASGTAGCSTTGALALITVTGNIVSVLGNFGIYGRIYWVPGSAQNYIQMPSTSGPTYIYASQAPALSNVLNTASEVLPTTGVWTAGTASASGGGSSTGY